MYDDSSGNYVYIGKADIKAFADAVYKLANQGNAR